MLHIASRRGHLGVVKLLLRRGADVDVLNNVGRSAAELALENGQAEVAGFISEYSKCKYSKQGTLHALLCVSATLLGQSG